MRFCKTSLDILSSGFCRPDGLVLGCLCDIQYVVHCSTVRSTHTSCSAQGQMVHLLGERAHHAGRLHGHSVVHGWRDHCTLVEGGKRQREGVVRGRAGERM